MEGMICISMGAATILKWMKSIGQAYGNWHDQYLKNQK